MTAWPPGLGHPCHSQIWSHAGECAGGDSCPASFTARQEPRVLPEPMPAAKRRNPDPGQFRLLERKCTARVRYVVTQNMRVSRVRHMGPRSPLQRLPVDTCPSFGAQMPSSEKSWQCVHTARFVYVLDYSPWENGRLQSIVL